MPLSIHWIMNLWKEKHGKNGVSMEETIWLRRRSETIDSAMRRDHLEFGLSTESRGWSPLPWTWRRSHCSWQQAKKPTDRVVEPVTGIISSRQQCCRDSTETSVKLPKTNRLPSIKLKALSITVDWSSHAPRSASHSRPNRWRWQQLTWFRSILHN